MILVAQSEETARSWMTTGSHLKCLNAGNRKKNFPWQFSLLSVFPVHQNTTSCSPSSASSLLETCSKSEHVVVRIFRWGFDWGEKGERFTVKGVNRRAFGNKARQSDQPMWECWLIQPYCEVARSELGGDRKDWQTPCI